MKNVLALGHAFNGKHLFENFPIEKLKITPKQVKEIYSDGNKRDLCTAIFVRSLELVINDIIEQNIHFKLPGMGTTQAYLYMNRTSGDQFRKAYKHGKWRDVDIFTSFETGYQIYLRMESRNKATREKPVYLSHLYKDKITEFTNSGRSY